MFRGRIRLVTLVAALPALAVLGCTSSNQSQGQGPVTSQPTTTTAATPTTAFKYTVVKDLCAHVTLDHVTKVMPHVEEDLYSSDPPSSPLLKDKEVGCEAVLGVGGHADVGVFSVTLDVYADAAERDEFSTLIWDEAVNRYGGTLIVGLGDKAVGYVDTLITDTDPEVFVLDGNASLSCGWVVRLGEEANAPSIDKMMDALEQSCRNTLASLRQA